MQLKNTLSGEVEVTFEGETYVLDAGETSKDFSPELVAFWKKVHAFLEVVEAEKTKTQKEPKEVEVKKENKETVK